MPNWMSDKDLALDSGDARTCDHCGTTYWVDEHHSCEAGGEASRKSAEAFDRSWKGTGKRRITTVLIVLDTPDSETAAETALDHATGGLFDDEGTDDVLGISWTMEKEVEVR